MRSGTVPVVHSWVDVVYTDPCHTTIMEFHFDMFRVFGADIPGHLSPVLQFVNRTVGIGLICPDTCNIGKGLQIHTILGG